MQPADTKLGKLRPGPPGIVLPAPVTAGTPVVVVRDNGLRNELGTDGAPIVVTRPSRVMRHSLFGVGLMVTRSGGARTTARIGIAAATPDPGVWGSADGTNVGTVDAPCVFFYVLSPL